VLLVSTGARTPLGRDAAASAAAYRAGINAAGDHPFLVDRSGDPMPAALDSELDADLAAPGRLCALASSALAEACEPLLGAGSYVELPLMLALPELRPGFSRRDGGSVCRHLQEMELGPVRISSLHVPVQGHAAGVAALAMGAAKVRTGEWPMCLVGGVDSYMQPETMEWLDDNRQLMGVVARSGFIPGEAAGFCLLANEDTCARRGLQALASVFPGGMAQEPMPIKGKEVSLGLGMTEAVAAAMPEASCLVDDVYCDQNGERYRGEEWGFVCLRLGGRFRNPTDYHAPADCWGDVGAASGTLFAMLACQAAQRRYAQGPLALLCAGSEGGLRSALVIARSF
jgi:3-oxoacyl-[acyl-carrier-protein] synthase I